MKLPKKPGTFLIIGMTVLLLGMLSLFLLAKGSLDLSKDEDPFPSIIMPPQAVYGGGYMDGGGVGILIVDHSGAKHEFTFPIDCDGIRNAHPTAFFGNMNDPNPVWLKNPERAKDIAIRLLDEFGKEMNDPSIDWNHGAARARRTLASPPNVVAIRAYDKLRRVFGY